MRRAQVNRFGGPNEIEIIHTQIPTPGNGELLIRVETAGVNPLDYKVRDGSSAAVRGFTDFPLMLGRECFGLVKQCGPGTTINEGTPVLGIPSSVTARGTHADYVVLAERDVAPVLGDVDPIRLGGVPIAALTAWHTVHEIARVAPGQHVLVIGAGGGVGQWLVQLCVAAGATVFASASRRHAERLSSYGAIHIDYGQTNPADVVPPLDVVFDGVYFDTFRPAIDLLKPDGLMVALPTLADLTPARERGIRSAVASLPPEKSALTHLAQMVTDSQIQVEVSEVLPLEELATAHRILEEGHSRGKVVIDLRLS